jgi:hypothetical protein
MTTPSVQSIDEEEVSGVYLTSTTVALRWVSETADDVSAPPRILPSAWARHVQVQVTSIDGSERVAHGLRSAAVRSR